MATDATSLGAQAAQPQTEEAVQETERLLHDISTFQAKLVRDVAPCLQLEPAATCARLQSGQPLLTKELLPPATAFLRQALTELRSWLPPAGRARLTLDQLLASNAVNRIALCDIIAEGEPYFQHLADDISQGPDVVAFLLGIVVAPFLQKQAEPYRGWIEAAAWRRGSCPVCGSQPWMARLSADNGRRSLACSLCHTEWGFERLRCPFCDNTDQARLRYFTVNGDIAHRVDCCDRCRRYIKTVDERASGGPANLLLEDVATVHLDALALQQGYR
jgi:formate dehydrogenase accessory protein FdhE